MRGASIGLRVAPASRKSLAMTAANLPFASIIDLAHAYRRRALSPVDVTRATLERIAALNPRYKAYVAVAGDAALHAARAAEAGIAMGQLRGPLAGVPIALKDLCLTEGLPTRGGSALPGGAAPDRDATVVARLRAAGAVVLGKLAMTEGAYIAHHPSVSPPVNPWNEGHMTGLSSSGPAVALAAGMAYGALGSDTGGSIRFPCAATGVSGIKPTYGRVSLSGILLLAQSLDHVGPMARSLADCAAMLAVIAGPDPADPLTLPGVVPDYAVRLERGLRGCRIGLDERYVTAHTDPDVANAVFAAADTFVSRGARILPVSLPSPSGFLAHFTDLVAVEAAIAHEATFPAQAEHYGPELAGLLRRGQALLATDMARLQAPAREWTARVRALFEDVDLLICPSWPNPAPPLQRREGAAVLDDHGEMLKFTAPWNFSGHPCVCFPGGFNRQGLPLGVQIIARHGEEELAIRAGHAFQQNTDWHQRHPKL